MKDKIDPMAMFRLSVLGQLIARDKLERGELSKIITELAVKTYNIPNSRHSYIGKKTIEKWYYTWLKKGIDGLAPKKRSDKGTTQIPIELIETSCFKKGFTKKNNP